jgi:hypothetical protein
MAKKIEGLDELVDVLTLWTERFQKMEKIGKIVLKVSRDAVPTLIQYLGMILKVDRSKEVEQLVATVLKIADPGMKKKNIGWQIRRAIKEWRRLHQRIAIDDESFHDPRVQESINQLISNLETQKK